MAQTIDISTKGWYHTLGAINRTVEKIFLYAAGILFAAFIVVVLLQVTIRNIFQISAMLWTVELATLLFLWTVYLGATIAIRQRRHYTLEVVPEEPRAVRFFVDSFANICVAVTLMILLYAGIGFLDNAARRLSIQLGITEFWFFVAVPLSALAMLLFLLEVMLQDWRRFQRAQPPRPDIFGL